MKFVSLETKRKIHKYMRRLSGGTAFLVMLGSIAAGIGFNVYLQHKSAGGPAEVAEKAEVQGKVDHLIATYNEMQAVDLLAKSADGQQAIGTNEAALKMGAAQLHQKFNAEAEATAIAIAHATKVSSSDLDDMTRLLKVVKPLPDYFIGPSGGEADFETFHYAQAQVMNRPGFTPTLASAREIAAKAKGTAAEGLFLLILGPALLSAAGALAFEGARHRLGRSIETEEKENQERAEAARKLDEERRKLAKERRKAARIAAVAEAAARPGKVAASMKSGLDRSIQVHKITLLPQQKAPPI
jgi:hypothetical protein